MSKATKKTNRKKKDKQNEHIKKPTETEIIDVTIPYLLLIPLISLKKIPYYKLMIHKKNHMMMQTLIVRLCH